MKLFLAVRRLVSDTIPHDPHHPDYRLRGSLAKFRRTKGRGLPPRYRLFWVFSEKARVIIMLYINGPDSLREQGGRKDPYVLFSGMLDRGEIGDSFEQNYRRWRRSDGAVGER